MSDPTTFREMASFWRDMAGLGDSRLKDERLRLADWFERSAAELEGDPPPPTSPARCSMSAAGMQLSM